MAVLGAVALVGVGIVAVAAVRIRSVTVALNFAGVLAAVACWASGETGGFAGADLVADAVDEAWVAHFDDGFDLGLGGGGESWGGGGVALRSVGAAADGVVGDLTALGGGLVH